MDITNHYARLLAYKYNEFSSTSYTSSRGPLPHRASASLSVGLKDTIKVNDLTICGKLTCLLYAVSISISLKFGIYIQSYTKIFCYQEAGSKVNFGSVFFFGDFSRYYLQIRKISYLYAKIPYAARQHSKYASILAIKHLCRLLFSVFRAIYFLRLWAMATSPHSTETFSVDFNLKRLNP